MINKKLLSFDRAALRYVGANVAFQWLGLVCNIIFVRAVARLVGAAFAGSLTAAALRQNILLCLGTVPLRFAFTMLASGMSDQASRDVKRTLRSKIYEKLTRLGPGYTGTVATSEVVMLPARAWSRSTPTLQNICRSCSTACWHLSPCLRCWWGCTRGRRSFCCAACR